MNERCRDMIALNMVPGLGPRRIAALLEAAGDTEGIFRLSMSALGRILKDKSGIAACIKDIKGSKAYAEELAYVSGEGIGVVCCLDSLYPDSLRNIYSPPPLLYYKGDIGQDSAGAVAVVGSRRCSMYGLRMAETISFDLAVRGVTVISGMARGIDSAAHRGALRAGGRTIAVMGSGFRHIYPASAGKLARDISASGAVVTEYPSYTEPSRSTFPRRNRIISGMAGGVLVVEAARKSGAMITVGHALEQGKDVMAVPGHADAHTAGGTNTLIQDGARLVSGASDVMDELSISPSSVGDIKVCTRPAGGVPPGGEAVLDALESGHPLYADDLTERTGLGPARLAEVLLRLEMTGRVKALAGRRYEIDKAARRR